MSDALGLYVRFVARPGRRDELAELLLEAAGLMAGARGCQAYVVNVSPQEPDTVWVTEIWRSAEDHEASLAARGVRELVERATPLLAGPPGRTELTPLGGAGLGP